MYQTGTFTISTMFQAFALVFLGGGAGSICRYAIWLAMRSWQHKFPWATFVANAAACLLLGMLLGRQASGLLSDQQRLLLVTGFCGGFSTYSTFTAETWGLLQSGHNVAMLANIFLQLAVCLGCLWVGMRLTV